MRHCKVCDQDKDPGEFYTKPNGKPRGYTCKDCQKTYGRQYNKDRKSGARTKQFQSVSETLSDEELARLREAHNVTLEASSFTPPKRPGVRSKPLPGWLEEWFTEHWERPAQGKRPA